MTLATIGWIIGGTICSVVVIAFVLSRMMVPPELFDKPPPPPAPEPRSDPPEGVVDLDEYRAGHWR